LWPYLQFAFSIMSAGILGRACSTHGGRRGAYGILVERPDGRRPLGRPRRRWDDNIKMYLQELGWGDMDWIDLAQDRDS